eukprot:14130713-Ditylum_brightwellii.AAC.1
MFDNDKEEDFGENETCGTLAEEDIEEEDATPVPPPAEADFATTLFCTEGFEKAAEMTINTLDKIRDCIEF